MGLVHDIEHIFCTCYKVRSAWQWTKSKIVELVTELGPPIAISNSDILMAMFPTGRFEVECTFLLGVYVEVVDREVVSEQKELLLHSLQGVVKFKIENTRSRAVPQIQIAV